MNLFKSNKQHISKTEMDRYLNNSISDKEKNSLESVMQDDPFLADAIDGFEQFPNEINNVPKLKKGNKNRYLIGVLTILIISIVVFFIFDNQLNKSKFTPKKTNLVVKNETTNNYLQETANDKEITVIEEQKTTPVVTVNKTTEQEQTVPLVRETISLEKYQATPEIYSQELNYDIKKVKIKTISYYNFLAVDYSVIYINQTPFEEIEIGTPASQSNSESYNLNADNKINKTVRFTYKEYLQKSLKLLSEQQYGNAINNFNVILKHYPNDVNAQFYIGFAHYNLKNYSKAISSFESVLTNSFDFFYEDAQWYKALSLQKNGHFKEANKLFRLIAKEKGFYAAQAAKK